MAFAASMAGTGLTLAAVPARAEIAALVIGIDRYTYINPLQGAVNDARDIADALKGLGVKKLRLFVDGDAERSRIIRAWRELVAETAPDSTLVLTFAGHGAQQPERVPGSEADGKDEFLVLADFAPRGPGTAQRLTDDEIAVLLKEAAPRRVIFISDSCHSGTMTRGFDDRAGMLGTRAARIDGKPVDGIEDDALPPPTRAALQAEAEEQPNVTFFAAVADHELAPEVMINRKPRGALSWVRTGAEAGVDLIVSGAGLPLKMPEVVEGTKAKIAPIISSGRAAALICKAWKRNGKRYPDALVLEGPRAGGHLGFTVEELMNPRPLEELLVEVLEAIAPFEKDAGRPIPVITAGGVYTGEDIARLISLGASGVQMGTRFVATVECDAHDTFKEQFVKCREEDIVIITSPVGMPLRAIRNEWLQDIIEGERKKFKCSYKCLHTCNAAKVQYCIADALYQADVEGNLYGGFVICGSTTHRIQEIIPVRQLMDELVSGAEAAFAGLGSVVPQATSAFERV